MSNVIQRLVLCGFIFNMAIIRTIIILYIFSTKIKTELFEDIDKIYILCVAIS